MTREEILNFLKLWEFSEKVSQRLLEVDFPGADVNDDDQWDFAEFKEWKKIKGKDEDFIQDDFNAVDKDNNGFISAEELAQLLMRIGASERVSGINIMIMMLDMDQDGFVKFYEYAAVMYDYGMNQHTMVTFQCRNAFWEHFL